jgi:hypothetical protein
MTTVRFDGLHLALAAIAGAAVAVAVGNPIPAAHAQDAGSWKCFHSDRIRDVEAAAKWGPLPTMSAALDQVAASSPRGTIFTYNPATTGSGTSPSSVCVKQ